VRARRALDLALRHPRHALLGWLVAGLLCAAAPVVAAALAAVLLATGPLLGDRRLTALALVGAAAVLAGGVGGAARLGALDRTGLGPQFEREIAVRAVLLERPRPVRGGAPWGGREPATALLRLRTGPGRGERVVARASRWPAVRVGAELAIVGRLGRLGPHDEWQRRRGAHGRLFAERMRATGHARGGVAGVVDRLRAGAEGAVSAGLDSRRAALARGMVLGEDEALSDDVRDDFRASGLAHLVAASGQNVALLAALAIGGLTALGASLRLRLLGALALVAVYVPLAGAGPSIQRAGVMGAAGLVAALAGRPASRAYALLLAAAATLAVNPRASADPGWQLSFAAVAAIAILAGPLAARLVERGVPRLAAEVVAMTGAATLATTPLIALHFDRVSLVSLPANVLAAPAVAPAMWLGLVAIVAGLAAPSAAILVNALAQFPLAFVGWVATATARLPFAAVSARPLPVFAATGLLGAAVAAWAHGRRLWPGPRRRPAIVAVGCVVLALLSGLSGCGRGASPPDPADLVVSFLDVGQGDATLVQHRGATVLVDTGPPGGPLLRRLAEAGVRRLDLLVITHAQADHEGEAAAVLDRYPVGLVLDGGDPSASGSGGAAASGAWSDAARVGRAPILAAIAHHHVRRAIPDAGEVLRAGPIELDVLWPRREPAAAHAGLDPNQRAIVAHLRDGDFDLLLPADAESDVTAALPLPAVDALKVAHHGSADPGTPDLLGRLHPRVAAIEVGRGNPYGHPTPQTLAALRAAVPAVYRTDRDGTVRLIVHGGAMRVTTGR
jgi:competence protein ComEC